MFDIQLLSVFDFSPVVGMVIEKNFLILIDWKLENQTKVLQFLLQKK